MDRPHLRGTRAVALSAAVLASLGTATAFAPAASANSAPAVTFDAPAVAGSSADLAFTVNRARHAIASADCTLALDGGAATPVPCGAPAAGPVRKSTVYATTVADLGAGDYVYEATITLTDGGTADASESFTVAPAEPVEFADAATACAGLGGSFVGHVSWWQLWTCDFDTTADQAASAEAGFGPLCYADGGSGFGGGWVGPGRYEVSCWLT